MAESIAPPARRLRIGEVSKLTGIPIRTLQNWARDGRVRATRLPSERWAFDRRDIAALILSGAEDPAPVPPVR